jgi:hypothetical protein
MTASPRPVPVLVSTHDLHGADMPLEPTTMGPTYTPQLRWLKRLHTAGRLFRIRPTVTGIVLSKITQMNVDFPGTPKDAKGVPCRTGPPHFCIA